MGLRRINLLAINGHRAYEAAQTMYWNAECCMRPICTWWAPCRPSTLSKELVIELSQTAERHPTFHPWLLWVDILLSIYRAIAQATSAADKWNEHQAHLSISRDRKEVQQRLPDMQRSAKYECNNIAQRECSLPQSVNCK